VLDDFHSKLLGLAKECYSMKLELPANAIRFVAEKSAKFHTTNTSTPVKNIAKYVQQIQENDNQMSTINQTF
jgi:hypothetical protein